MVKQKEYLLDTNVCIALLKNSREIKDRVFSIGQAHCFISEITIAELFYGAAKSGRAPQMEDVSKITSMFDTIPIYPSLRIYGEIKALLEQKGQRLDEFDLLIGASAIQNRLTIVTANQRHFLRIPNIQIEDWSL